MTFLNDVNQKCKKVLQLIFYEIDGMIASFKPNWSDCHQLVHFLKFVYS